MSCFNGYKCYSTVSMPPTMFKSIHQHHIICVSAFFLAQSKILPNFFKGFLQSSNQWIGLRENLHGFTMVLPILYHNIYGGFPSWRFHLWDPSGIQDADSWRMPRLALCRTEACATAWLSTTLFPAAKAL